MTRKWLILLVVMAFYLPGCSPLHAGLEPDGKPLKPRITISMGAVSGEPTPVDALMVSKIERSVKKPVWSIVPADKARPAVIDGLVYGEVPDGYKEQFPARSLRVETQYELFIRRGDATSVTRFSITRENGRHVLSVD